MKVDFTAEESGELFLEIEVSKAGDVARFEFHENIDVAVGTEVVAKHRAEEGQPADVVPLAEVGDLAPVDGDSR